MLPWVQHSSYWLLESHRIICSTSHRTIWSELVVLGAEGASEQCKEDGTAGETRR